MAYEIDEFPGRQIQIGTKTYTYFGGTSYLGLQMDNAFQELYIANVKNYGTNYGASRKSNIRLRIFEQAESYLANLIGSEGCTTLSSGYLAGQLIARQFNTDEYTCFYAPNTHSALFSDKSECFESLKALAIAVQHHSEKDTKKTSVIFMDSIDFSGVNYPHFKVLEKLPLERVILVVDDSHGIGIIGKKGGGIFRQLYLLRPKELIVCCSLGKGFGIQAGAIFGTKKRMLQLTDTDFFGGASPAAPAVMATLLQGEYIYEKKRAILQENIQLFIREIADTANFRYMIGHPAFSFSNLELTAFLENNNVVITSFNYPNADSTTMNRIVISATHTTQDIIALAKNINTFFK